MKTTTTKNFAKKAVMAQAIGLMVLSSQGLQAQDDLLFATDSVLESQQLDIDGYHNRKPQKSAADKMADMRRRLEKQNEDMVHRKIEDVRIKEEARLTRQLQNAFTHGMNNIGSDQVSTQQAAVQKVEAPAPVEKTPELVNRIIPTFGVLNIKGTEIDFESKLNMGIGFESIINERFAVGFALNYAKMDITDYSNVYMGNSYYDSSFMYGGYYNSGYNQAFGQGRTIGYNRLQMEVNSKIYFATGSMIRPFAGVGLNYNRSKLKYQDDGQNYSFNNYQFGNEGYSSNYLGGSAGLGTEVLFSKNVGAQLDFRYNRGLTGGFSSKSEDNGFKNPDQLRLENIGKAIEEADFFSLNAGIVVSF